MANCGEPGYRDELVNEVANFCAKQAFNGFAEILGGDDFVTSSYDGAIFEFAWETFISDMDESWSQEELATGNELIYEAIWSLTKVPD